MTIVEGHTELLKFLVSNMVENYDSFAPTICHIQNFEYLNLNYVAFKTNNLTFY